MRSNLLKIINFAKENYILVFLVVQIIHFIWYNITFHYIYATKTEKRISTKRLFVKWATYMLPIWIVFGFLFLDSLKQVKQIRSMIRLPPN